jgi:hypothetical protein
MKSFIKLGLFGLASAATLLCATSARADMIGSACDNPTAIPAVVGVQAGNFSAAVVSVAGPGGVADVAVVTTTLKDLSAGASSSGGTYGAGVYGNAAVTDHDQVVYPVYPYQSGMPMGFTSSAE